MIRSAFTIATGGEAYLQLAVTLARSISVHNAASVLKCYIYTDFATELPQDLTETAQIVRVPQWLPKGIEAKLWLDRLAPTEESLFIDSDCLCYGDLTPVFDRFAGHAVSVVGFPVASGEWCGADARIVCAEFGVAQIPRFNGGLYYIEKGDRATAIYDTARRLVGRYDELGFTRHRGWINEEPLVSIALAIHDETPVIDDGTIMSDFGPASRPRLDVLTGRCALQNPPASAPGHKWWYPGIATYSPLVIHFAGPAASSFPYTREKANLTLTAARHWPSVAARLVTAATRTAPALLVSVMKSAGRPLYRRLFGPRAVVKSDRTFGV